MKLVCNAARFLILPNNQKYTDVRGRQHNTKSDPGSSLVPNYDQKIVTNSIHETH